MWKNRKVPELVGECLVIQGRLAKSKTNFTKTVGELFQKQMIKGNINGALRLLSKEQCNGSILPLDPPTMDELRLKHPDASPLKMIFY